MTQSERDKISQLRGQIEATIELLYAIKNSLEAVRNELCDMLNREEELNRVFIEYATGLTDKASETYTTGHNENDTVTSEEEYLTECDKCEFRNKCLTQKSYWRDKNGREHIKTLFECPYEYLCEVTE